MVPEQVTVRLENLLCKRRIDLWAVSRVLVHCKESGLNKSVWALLSDEDKSIIKDIHAGRMPEAFKTTGV